MSSSSQFRVNSAWMMVLAVAQRLIGAVSTAVIANALGPAQLGAYAVATTTANNAYGVSRLGVDMGVHVLASAKDPVAEKAELEELLGVATTLFLGMAALGAMGCIVFSAPIALLLFRTDELLPFVQIAALLLFGQVVTQLAYVIFAGLHTFRAYARILMIVSPLVAIATALTALVSGAFRVAFVAGAAQVVLGAALVMVAIRTAHGMGLNIRPRLGARPVTAILRVGLPFYLAGLIALPVDYLAQASLVRGHSVSALGDLRVVVAIIAVVSLLPGALNGPMISAFSRIHGGARDIDALFSQTLRGVWTVALFGSLVVGLAWPLLVSLFGADYDDARTIGFIALIYAVGVCLRNVWSNRLLSSERQGLLVLVNSADAVVFAICALLLVPRFGLAGYLVAQASGVVAPLLGATAVALVGGHRAVVRSYLIGGALSVLALALVTWFNLGSAALATRIAAAAIAGTALAATWSLTMIHAAERRAMVAAVSNGLANVRGGRK